jgi:hypothetical protein
MQSPNQKFTNPGDARNPSVIVGGLATGRFYPWRPGIVWRDGDRETRSPGRSAQFDRRLAIHEAAHATVSRLLGLSVSGSTIEFIDGHHGLTWASEAALQPGAETVESICAALTPLMPCIGEDRTDIAVELERASCQVIALLAGPLAETLFTAEPLPGTGHDLAEARSLASLIVRSPRSINSYLAYAQAEARALLVDNRDVVLAISDALLKHRTIYAEQIDVIITAALLCQTLEASHG